MKKDEQRLSEIGEDALVASLTASLRGSRDVIVGPGDDCAVLRSAVKGHRNLFKADCLVEGVHFDRRHATPSQVGWKAMARALSDIAAMGGRPGQAVVTLVASADEKVLWVRGVYRGLERAAREFGVPIVGGETSQLPARGGKAMMLSVALTGEVETRRCILRSGGRPGDALFVTGRLGGSLGGRHLRFRPRLEEARWLTAHFSLHAMMDLSDGLARDLPRLAQASEVGFELDRDRVPRSRGCDVDAALTDGEDYELLFALDSRRAAALEKAWRAAYPSLALTRIGTLVKDRRAGSDLRGGWDHFRK